MNWFQKAQLPDRFKDMTPEQIEAEFNTLEQQKAELAGRQPSKPEESDAFKNIQTQLQETQARLAELQAAPPVVRQSTEDQTPQRTSFLEDEDQAFNERVAPLANMTLQNTATMARQIAVQELREETDTITKETNNYVLQNYKKEIDDLYASMPIQARTSPMAFKNVVGVVKDRHLGDVFKAVTKDKGQSFFEQSSPSTSGRGDEPASAEGQLTPGQIRVARKMKMTPAEYLKSMKGLKMTQETGGYAEVRTDG